jgi:hypothetical protein
MLMQDVELIAFSDGESAKRMLPCCSQDGRCGTQRFTVIAESEGAHRLLLGELAHLSQLFSLREFTSLSGVIFLRMSYRGIVVGRYVTSSTS